MKALATALVEAQKAMPAVKADARNPHFNSEFVSLDHLIAVTKPVLTKYGLAILQAPHTVDGTHVLRTSLVHVEGDAFEFDTPLLLNGKNDMQALGAATTYARRYAWASVLGICDQEDDDGNSASSGGLTLGGLVAGGAGAADPASAPKSPPKPAAAALTPAAAGTPGSPTEKQLNFLGSLLGQRGFKTDDLGKPLDQLTKGEVSKFIEALKGGTFAPITAAEQELSAVGGGEWVDADADIPFDRTAS